MEFALIERIRRRAGARGDVVLGIGDDAALLQVPAGKLLAVATDTLNIDVHFPGDTAPADIGWKSLAVNLSDLAAMGAAPAWATLSLSLPHADEAWVDGFLDGFLTLATQHDVALVGGDTTRGPLSVCVTVHGFVDAATALRRDGACAGDDVWVSGTLGDAAAALVQWRAGGAGDPLLRARLDRPTPRVTLGLGLGGIASAAIDLSDGLSGDLRHICEQSRVGAEIDVDALPISSALRRYADSNTVDPMDIALQGGEDYELLFTVDPRHRKKLEQLSGQVDCRLTCIGIIKPSPYGLRIKDHSGSVRRLPMLSYQHFTPPPIIVQRHRGVDSPDSFTA